MRCSCRLAWTKGRAGRRYHHGFVGQDVAAVIAETGVDFGGYQNHSINGGDQSCSIGYEELIAPLVKAVQELSTELQTMRYSNWQLAGRVATLEAATRKQ